MNFSIWASLSDNPSQLAGHFLSADPLGHAGSMDLQSFCNGDPINRFDPTGRLGKSDFDDVKAGWPMFRENLRELDVKYEDSVDQTLLTVDLAAVSFAVPIVGEALLEEGFGLEAGGGALSEEGFVVRGETTAELEEEGELTEAEANGGKALAPEEEAAAGGEEGAEENLPRVEQEQQQQMVGPSPRPMSSLTEGEGGGGGLGGAGQPVAPEAASGASQEQQVGVNFNGTENRAAAEGGVSAYEVGTYDALKARSLTRDALDIHHVGQARPFEQLIPGYDRATAPAIALPEAEHAILPTIRGTTTMMPRDILANDIRNLRNFTEAPNSSLQQLIDLNKQLYPNSFTK